MATTDGIVYTQGPVDFSKLLGTYCWVWDGQREMLRDHEIGPDISEKEDEGFITLSLKGNALNLDNVCGSFKYGSWKGTFEGIKPFEMKSSQLVPGVWNIKCTLWVDAKGNMDEEGQELWATERTDDYKHPFVGMYLDAGYYHGLRMAWDVVGKKQKEGYVYGVGDWEGLSDKEKRKLRLKEENSDGEYEEDEDKEDSSEDSRSENEDDTSEDEDGTDESEDELKGKGSEDEDEGNGEDEENGKDDAVTEEPQPKHVPQDTKAKTLLKRKASISKDANSAPKAMKQRKK